VDEDDDVGSDTTISWFPSTRSATRVLVEPMDQSSPLRQPERLRLDEQVASVIADAIIDGRYQPGTLLPPERELADQLGVNRTSLRQGLARLEQMGLIEARQGTGNLVCDPAGLTTPAVVEALIRRLGPDLLVEMLDVRQALGPLIGRLAVERAGDDDVDALRGALDRVDAARSAAQRQAADLDFFKLLVHATHNRALSLLFRWVESAYGGRAHELTAAFESGDAVVAGLTGILDAVTARNGAEAEQAVESYLHDSAARMVEAYVRALAPS
jgi:DNA-binding FadR family transcriptional regulator